MGGEARARLAATRWALEEGTSQSGRVVGTAVSSWEKRAKVSGCLVLSLVYRVCLE